MATTQVTSLHPVRVYASNATPFTVENKSAATVYYRAAFFPSGLKGWETNDGELAEGAKVEIVTPTSFITKKTAYTGVETKELDVEAELLILPVLPIIPGRREIESVNAVLKEGEAVGTYVSEATTKEWKKMTALKLTTAENTSLNYFYYEPGLYEVAGKPTTLTLEMLIMSNATACTASFIAGIYKFSKAEGEKKHEVTVEAAVAASAAEIVTPAAKVVVQKAVTFSSSALAAGAYVLGFETITATTAAKSAENITLTVFASN